MGGHLLLGEDILLVAPEAGKAHLAAPAPASTACARPLAVGGVVAQRGAAAAAAAPPLVLLRVHQTLQAGEAGRQAGR